MYKIKFLFIQLIKMIFQNIVLPFVYNVNRKNEIDTKLIVFADSNHATIPFSMEKIHAELLERGYKITDFFFDSEKEGRIKSFIKMSKFMSLYSKSKYIFICDYFFPISSCRKKKETIVIQLWHSCGLLKKIGYDTEEDIPRFYKGDMFSNYNYFTVSSKLCGKVLSKALRIPEYKFISTGVSRTDFYFDKSFIEKKENQFYGDNPTAKGKKIVLWAPTYRGHARNPQLEGLNEILEIQNRLSKTHHIIIKAHPHLDKNALISNCDMKTEELLCVADILITDYSSILYDYLIFKKQTILYVPDLEIYKKTRGFYIDISSIPAQIAINGEDLMNAIMKEDKKQEQKITDNFYKIHMENCDGLATQKIIEKLNLTSR